MHNMRKQRGGGGVFTSGVSMKSLGERKGWELREEIP
jgi:hypothetical protein